MSQGPERAAAAVEASELWDDEVAEVAGAPFTALETASACGRLGNAAV